MNNCERNLRTKEMLSEALREEMKVRPINRITVSDLVRRCNINRNTFYYHFRDIYDLLEWGVKQELEGMLTRTEYLQNAEKGIRYMLDYLEKNRSMIDSLYKSLGYDMLQQYVFGEVNRSIKRFVEEALQREGLMPEGNLIDFLAVFYTHAVSGMLISWVKGQWHIDKEEMLQNMLLMLRSGIPAMMDEHIK